MLKSQTGDHMGSITSDIDTTDRKSNQRRPPFINFFVSFWARIKFLFGNALTEVCDCSVSSKSDFSNTEPFCFKSTDDFVEAKSCRLNKLPPITYLESSMLAPLQSSKKGNSDVIYEQPSEPLLKETSKHMENHYDSFDTLKAVLQERLEPIKIPDEGSLSATLTFSHPTMTASLAPETYLSNIFKIPHTKEEVDLKDDFLEEGVCSPLDMFNDTELSQPPTILGRLYAKLRNNELTTEQYEKLSSSVIASTIPRNLSDSDETRKPLGANELYAWRIPPPLPTFDPTGEASSRFLVETNTTNPDALVDFVISDAVREVSQYCEYDCIEEAKEQSTSNTHQVNCCSSIGTDFIQINSSQAYDIYNDDFQTVSLDRARGSTICSSLKSERSSDDTHCRKIVRFADSLGLDLATVRQVKNTDHPPSIPASATIDLNLDTEKSFSSLGAKQFQICFPQPGVCPSFMNQVLQSFVRLENARVDSSRGLLTGTIRVKSVGFEKKIFVRITYDNWSTYCEIPASYVQGSHDGITDRFSFSAVFPSSMVANDRAQFAVRYETHAGVVYWDNNLGENYVVHCCAKATDMAGDGSWIHFL